MWVNDDGTPPPTSRSPRPLRRHYPQQLMDTKPRDLRSTRGIDMQVLAGLAVVNQKITRQAAMIAYVDDFVLMLVATIVVAPLILLIRPPKKSGGEQVHVAME
jgi:hypothetical protein